MDPGNVQRGSTHRTTLFSTCLDRFKTQEMCNGAVRRKPYTLWHVPNHLRTSGMCIRAVEKCLHPLRFIADHPKT